MLDFILSAWEWIKKTFVKILNFARNIINWFQDPKRLRALQEDKDRLAVVVKENLKNGNCNIINCLFNKRTEKIEGVHNESNTNAEGITSEELDSETKNNFGNKDMLVLE